MGVWEVAAAFLLQLWVCRPECISKRGSGTFDFLLLSLLHPLAALVLTFPSLASILNIKVFKDLGESGLKVKADAQAELI